MVREFKVIPSPPIKEAVQRCPLLETEKARGEWVECCSQRFFPLARRIAGDNDLAMDVLQTSGAPARARIVHRETCLRRCQVTLHSPARSDLIHGSLPTP